MGPFKFLSLVFTATAGVIVKGLKAVENIASIAEDTTDAMLQEQQVINASRITKLKADTAAE